MKKIGVIGSGFIAKGLLDLINSKKEYAISNILTRAKIQERDKFPYKDFLTNSLQELIDNSDIIVECSGDVEYATKTISKIMENDIPIVTMNYFTPSNRQRKYKSLTCSVVFCIVIISGFH